jgi:hypothetical protein
MPPLPTNSTLDPLLASHLQPLMTAIDDKLKTNEWVSLFSPGGEFKMGPHAFKGPDGKSRINLP